MDSKPPSPEVLSMETSTRDDSYFRIRYNDKVKYVVVIRGTFNSDELCLPLYSLPPLPYEDDGWTVARVSRNPGSPQLQFVLENRPLQGVKEIWHPEQVDCLALKRVQRLTMNVSECTRKGQEAPQSTVIAKSRDLRHVVEQGRVIGFVLEKLHGKSASIEHRARCTEVLGRLHRLGLLHGDVNRHNFMVGDGWTKMIDFEKSKETQDEGLVKAEVLSLLSKLEDESGRGAGFL
ncbi:hypothetical protein NPX13_g10331 [Xylaria arbuscula]|uniref:Protein kinase domain-containing protein n=1 Tax=Xylaria arbuscula TaxID=114810 RepID=A0A9W8N4R9_9PEZI|nr:hypothetical protein NPX13_g10331 [Xylaria arbuscula]